MKFIFMTIISICLTSPLFAKSIKCQIDKAVLGGEKIEVPVTVIRGPILVEDQKISLEGSTVSAKYQLGDEYDSQTYLQLKFDDMVSTIYKVNKASRYDLTKGHLRFQCWFAE